MKVLIASSSVYAIPVFDVLSNSPQHQIVGLLTNQDKPTGRGQKIESNELAIWAQTKNYLVFKAANQEELILACTQSSADIVITIAFGQIVKNEALKIPRFGWLNIHFSILPKWRGAAPIQHSILNGEKSTGISIFKLDKGMDTGPIYLAKEFPIINDETASELLNRLSLEGSKMLPSSLAMVEEGVAPYPQSTEGVSYAPKFFKKDSEINWKRSSESIYNLYRALGTNPGIWSELNGIRIRVDTLGKSELNLGVQPGEMRIDNEKMYVGTLDGNLEILRLTPAGRNSMSAGEFIRGLSSKVGLTFG